MNKQAIYECLFPIRKRYLFLSVKNANSQLLEQIVEIIGYSRKEAIRLIKGPQRHPRSKSRQRGRPVCMESPDIAIIKEIWLLGEQSCGKRLFPMLKEWFFFWEEKYSSLKQMQKERILSVSSATLDRVLGEFKVNILLRRNFHSLGAIKAQISIRLWSVDQSGWIEADIVAHGGGNSRGSYCMDLNLNKYTERVD